MTTHSPFLEYLNSWLITITSCLDVYFSRTRVTERGEVIRKVSFFQETEKLKITGSRIIYSKGYGHSLCLT